jgi:hypothetical protein
MIKQNDTTAYTVGWSEITIWPGGTAPTMTPTLGKTDIFTFVYDGSFFYGNYSQNYPTV